MREQGQRETKQACRLVWIVVFFLLHIRMHFPVRVKVWPWQRSHKSLFICNGLVLWGRETERGAVEASTRQWDWCHTRATLGWALERRQYRNCPEEVRSVSSNSFEIYRCAHGISWHGAPWGCLPIWEAGWRVKGLCSSQVDGLMWFRGSAKACWGPRDGTWKMIHEYWVELAWKTHTARILTVGVELQSVADIF